MAGLIKNVQAALACAFPETKFSISRGSLVCWTDGPNERQVADALEAARCVEGHADGFGCGLHVNGVSLSFYRRRGASNDEIAARRAKSVIDEKLREQFPETEFTLHAHAICDRSVMQRSRVML
jgi:hypothetical protein